MIISLYLTSYFIQFSLWMYFIIGLLIDFTFIASWFRHRHNVMLTYPCCQKALIFVYFYWIYPLICGVDRRHLDLTLTALHRCILWSSANFVTIRHDLSVISFQFLQSFGRACLTVISSEFEHISLSDILTW